MSAAAFAACFCFLFVLVVFSVVPALSSTNHLLGGALSVDGRLPCTFSFLTTQTALSSVDSNNPHVTAKVPSFCRIFGVRPTADSLCVTSIALRVCLDILCTHASEVSTSLRVRLSGGGRQRDARSEADSNRIVKACLASK